MLINGEFPTSSNEIKIGRHRLDQFFDFNRAIESSNEKADLLSDCGVGFASFRTTVVGGDYLFSDPDGLLSQQHEEVAIVWHLPACEKLMLYHFYLH